MDLRDKANNWLKFVRSKYSDDIESSIERTYCKKPVLAEDMDLIYYPSHAVTPEIEMQKTDTVSAVFDNYEKNKRMAILNFANYYEPGGGFLRGARAQEECICHESTLYPVILSFDEDYYAKHRENLNDFLYDDEMLYSRDIVFIREGKGNVCADVITAAAPCLIDQEQYICDHYGEYCVLVKNRIKKILTLAIEMGVDSLILGAWGCGAFRNDPKDVSRLFKEAIHEMGYTNTIQKIIFAIPQTNSPLDANYNIFEEMLLNTPSYASSIRLSDFAKDYLLVGYKGVMASVGDADSIKLKIEHNGCYFSTRIAFAKSTTIQISALDDIPAGLGMLKVQSVGVDNMGDLIVKVRGDISNMSESEYTKAMYEKGFRCTKEYDEGE